jgi:hypothetical protein
MDLTLPAAVYCQFGQDCGNIHISTHHHHRWPMPIPVGCQLNEMLQESIIPAKAEQLYHKLVQVGLRTVQQRQG